MKKLILASQSPSRRALLARLGLPFEVHAPNVNETPLKNEDPNVLSMRLAKLKASTIGQHFPDALIIASDQVACLGQTILSKPGTVDKARAHLKASSNQCVTFYTSLCVLEPHTTQHELYVSLYRVYFRTLTDNMIDYYLQHEDVLNCAGSFKSEGLGISLFRKWEGDDPTSLMGLPLMVLCDILPKFGVNVLS